jgi:hypothetical protein
MIFSRYTPDRRSCDNSGSDAVSDMSLSDDTFEEHSSKHEIVWNLEINGKRRIVSQGDLKYDLDNHVLILLPFYWKNDRVVKMRVVTGTIVNINSVILSISQDDVPRETKLIDSSEDRNIYNDNSRNWAKSLVISNWKENTDSACQTMVTSYVVKLDKSYAVTEEQIKQIYMFSAKKGCLPFNYDLNFYKSDSGSKLHDMITVDYRYVMGKTHRCFRLLSEITRTDIIDITPDHVESHLLKLKLSSGVYVRYRDSDENRRNSGIVHFVVLDHICTGILDVKFVIRCTSEPVRILAISKVYPFNVRLSFPVESYYLFHPLERYIFEILEEKNIDLRSIGDGLKTAIRELIYKTFSQLKVYIVKKSLCQPNDIDSHVFEDREGDIKIIPVNEIYNSDLRRHAGKTRKVVSYEYQFEDNSNVKGYKFTGISLASYVKGLAYPENESPAHYNNYIFFHSKDYYQLCLDPLSEDFFNYICISGKQKDFRNPTPKDVILADSFICDKEPYNGKLNLRWFYPDNDFRLLHLFITTDGRHPHFSEPKKSDQEMTAKLFRLVLAKNQLSFHYLALFDLFIHGISRHNPTIESNFTQTFIRKFLFWNKFVG